MQPAPQLTIRVPVAGKLLPPAHSHSTTTKKEKQPGIGKKQVDGQEGWWGEHRLSLFSMNAASWTLSPHIFN